MAIDYSFLFCSLAGAMSRVDDETLSLHLEVALSTAPPALLDGLTDSDRRRRHAAVGQIARQLVDRLRCFEIRSDDDAGPVGAQACLFPNDLGPIGRTG
ncbi:hypothetical protein [Sphingopyxis sp. 550A]|jgi:hypothetical protein